MTEPTEPAAAGKATKPASTVMAVHLDEQDAARLGIPCEPLEIDIKRITFAEARSVKKLTGFTVREWFAAFKELDPDALQAVAYLAIRRGGHLDIRYTDIDECSLLSTFDQGENEPPAEVDADGVPAPDPTDGAQPPTT